MLNSVELKEAIIIRLYDERKASSDDVGAIEVGALARDLDQDVKLVAMACRDLVIDRKLDGDGNMMGYVRISDPGIGYVDAVRDLA